MPRGMHRASLRTKKSIHSPNAVHILADLVGIGALKLAELRISLNLEEDLVACLRRHLHIVETRKKVIVVSPMHL